MREGPCTGVTASSSLGRCRMESITLHTPLRYGLGLGRLKGRGPPPPAATTSHESVVRANSGWIGQDFIRAGGFKSRLPRLLASTSSRPDLFLGRAERGIQVGVLLSASAGGAGPLAGSEAAAVRSGRGAGGPAGRAGVWQMYQSGLCVGRESSQADNNGTTSTDKPRDL